MVKLRFLLMAVLMLVASTQMYAGWRVVVDKNCIKIVSSNLAAQKLIEEQHNARLDTIAAKQQKVELYSVSMASPVSVRRACTTRKSAAVSSTSSGMCRN